MSALSLTDAKTHLAITVNDFDLELEATIDAAEAALSEQCGPLASTVVTRRVPGGTWALSLPVTPAIDLTSVTPYQGTALTISDLYLNTITGQVTFNNLTPFVSPYYDVVYNAGRSTCPADLLLADKELVRHLWETRRGPTGRGSPGSGDRATSRTTPGAAYLFPYRVSELIARHIQIGVG